MKILIGFLLILFSITAMAEAKPDCGPAKLHYKIKKEVFADEVEICKNEYSQFYAKKCADGCEFKAALKEKNDFDLEAEVGSPGGQICQELGLESRIVEVEFKDKRTPHVDICYGKDKTHFVSTGFLRDLLGGF